MGNPVTTKSQSVATNGKIGNATQTQIPSGSGNLAVSIPAMNIPQPYDGGTVQGQLQNDALAKQYTSNKYYDSLTNQAPKLMDQNSRALQQADGLLGKGVEYVARAGEEGDSWYGKAGDAYGKADSLLGQLTNNLEYTREGNKWYDDYTRGMLGRSQNLLDTGQIPQPIMDAMLSSMTRGVNQSVGANVNGLAARGVLNSSVSNRALADASRSVSDSMNANYLDAFNTLLTGTNDTARAGAEGGRAFADVNFNLNNNYQNAMDSATKLGESYGLTGTRRVGDLLGVAAGYDDSAAGYGALGNQWLNTLAQNRSERESLMNAIPGYWDNTLAPMGFTQMTLQQGLDEYLNHEKDTVVSKSGGLCFITTAACDYLGKPDDCYELTTFRDFRDMWLRFQPGGEAMVRMYYKEAPRIVGRLNDSPEKDAVYRKLWSEYLTPCVAFIKAREYERCRDMYLTMVFMLMEMFPDESEAA